MPNKPIAGELCLTSLLQGTAQARLKADYFKPASLPLKNSLPSQLSNPIGPFWLMKEGHAYDCLNAAN
jgi:hypothetical protein